MRYFLPVVTRCSRRATARWIPWRSLGFRRGIPGCPVAPCVPEAPHTVPGCPTEVHRSTREALAMACATIDGGAHFSADGGWKGKQEGRAREEDRSGTPRFLSPAPVDPQTRIPRGGCNDGHRPRRKKRSLLSSPAICAGTTVLTCWSTEQGRERNEADQARPRDSRPSAEKG